MTEKEFLDLHAGEDALSLRLRYAGKNLDFDLEEALVQIEARKKAAKKLSRFIGCEGFRFPSVVASEQATDQRVASFHAQLVAEISAKEIIDLTSGLGIDPMTMALENPGARVTAIEIDERKAECLRKNSRLLGLQERVKVINGDCRDYLAETSEHFDLLFADPARRNVDGGRCYAIRDCEPDLSRMMPEIFRVSDTFMLKVSPMLDVTEILREIEGITELYAVSLKGELKEVLVKGRKGGTPEKFSAVTIYDDGDYDEFVFSPEAINLALPIVEDMSTVKPGMFLYEPDATIMKFGCFGAIASRFPGLLKLHPNTHLFVSEWEYNCFPGRKTKIESLPDKKELKQLKGTKINVAVRNYPLTAEQLKRKLSVRDGGTGFLYGVRVGRAGQPLLIRTSLSE